MISLMAAVVLLQQETAEETFKRFEQTLVQAKSLRLRYRLDLAVGNQSVTGTGIVLLKDGNKARITLTGAKGNPWAVSDGTKVTVDARQAIMDGATFDTPKELNIRVATKMVRWGMLDLPDFPRRIKVYDVDPKEKLKVSDFKFGDKDGDLQTLTYVVQEGNGQADLKLWVDPKSLALKKRTLSVAKMNATATETYEEFTLNGEIPDEMFKP
jgi:outer membrane lipoprotein-sorting protein